MDRRELLGVLGATAAGLATVAGAGEARASQEGKDDIHERCARACMDCEMMCNHAFHHCYEQIKAGKQDYARPMHLCVDCGDVCSTAGKLVARMSPLMTHTCRACAASCDDCIAACEKLDTPDIKEFVATLRKCAKSCREMVQAMGGLGR
jgi:hypothetical protein